MKEGQDQSNWYPATQLSGTLKTQEANPQSPALETVCLLVACLTSQQHASVSQGRICLTSQQHASVSQGQICLTSQQHASVSQGRICLTSQQHASVSQGQICKDNFMCCHTETYIADPTFYLTQSQYTDTGPTSPSADPITPGPWQGRHWSVNF